MACIMHHDHFRNKLCSYQHWIFVWILHIIFCKYKLKVSQFWKTFRYLICEDLKLLLPLINAAMNLQIIINKITHLSIPYPLSTLHCLKIISSHEYLTNDDRPWNSCPLKVFSQLNIFALTSWIWLGTYLINLILRILLKPTDQIS